LSIPISFLLAVFLGFSLTGGFSSIHGQIKDPNLEIETIFSGLEFPTAMAFLGPDDMLVTEKNTGKVLRIVDGELAKEPLLQVNVANQIERGLLGMAVSKNLSDNKSYVFLYYTEAAKNKTIREGAEISDDGSEAEPPDFSGGNDNRPLGNRLYRYELSEDGTKLLNPKMLLDLPYEPGPAHNGGTITIGGYNNSNNVCVIIGNLHISPYNEGEGTNQAQNIRGGDKPDGRAGIICVTQNGQKIKSEPEGERGILGDEHPLDMYFAYGIRNSFGLAFDPITGHLWDTENGGYDEINLVEPGFNSGFSVITGSSLNEFYKDKFDRISKDLLYFNGNGKYSDPELDLGQLLFPPTAIVFLNSKALGNEYENDLFVASVNGKILHFELDQSRRQLALEGELTDKIAVSEEDLEDVVIADHLGTITDLKVGPDGYLYGVILRGDIVRIVPEEADVGKNE
jgi:glucose/arabinose dehydrogenase